MDGIPSSQPQGPPTLGCPKALLRSSGGRPGIDELLLDSGCCKVKDLLDDLEVLEGTAIASIRGKELRVLCHKLVDHTREVRVMCDKLVNDGGSGLFVVVVCSGVWMCKCQNSTNSTMITEPRLLVQVVDGLDTGHRVQDVQWGRC